MVPLADAAPAKLSEAIAVAPVDETESLKSQLADKQLAPQVRAAAAVRVKWLAGQGRADLVGAQLDDAALDDAYFFSANFTNASLKAAKLSGVNFFAATLINADLSDAELVDADLRGVNAIGANLMRADLTRAILFGADLSDARLDGANLQAARLQGANLITAQLVGADLRGALFSTQQGGGYPTRFPQGFQPKQHGMIECPGAHECAFSVPDPGPRADGSWEP
ncbi:MAG TPA: pentapeptide repeat-containing protein [Polyangiaceae bacterium]|nr:pentapeptide repeat-containing protein [Polyangiaceae bacterium]